MHTGAWNDLAITHEACIINETSEWEMGAPKIE